ncbi:helix-turn-helix transcriptional regulator [Streptomyces sp. DH24]|uniref:helix-turn-helix domain-containing protein n=1 Tax=Streptomyces sp. DH24 TaxID=3040123 RepID=UPI002442A408|nr:helix-turn-helix transcriptional regulator [Streptomyces sp. DH24]MDG9718518.1 helix-turn-helix transcriptional regulator [Streptomyces sp. DH24]
MVAGDEFSELLGRLKERSGLSYGVLGKRLHTSASTLHRYVNGDAVPTDYAPVERFARVCRATPEELVELHRLWVLADARRGQKASGARMEEEPREVPAAAGAGAASTTAPEAGAAVGPQHPAPNPVGRRRRTLLLAGAALAAALVSTVLVVSLLPGKADDDRRDGQPVGAAGSPSPGTSPGASAPTDAKGRSASPSASGSGSPSASASASRSGGAGAARGGGTESGATAPTVAVDPYTWEGPCSQHYLIDRKPEQVPPPPSEPDARGWVTALGGVAGGQQMLTLTVQGTGRATVVLEDLHVRVVDKSAPLAWNDFAMGVGCGGGVETTAFGVDLDAGRPVVSPRAGQRDFPYKVSESDPEVFYVFADARAHNVSWYLELDWSSGDKQGTVRVDDNGRPFRTSGNTGRPAYTRPLGASEWGRDGQEPGTSG